jgi:hypothetical protein
MTTLLFADLAEFSPAQLLALWLSLMGIGALVLISVVGIWAGAWTNVNRLRLDHAIKQQMVDRGLSTDEMLAVLTGTRHRDQGDELPCASEVAVNIDGEWHAGLILKRDADRYFIHLVGTEMSDNQWVSGERIRFPAPSEGGCGKAVNWSFLSDFARTASQCGNGEKAKPAGVDQDM